MRSGELWKKRLNGVSFNFWVNAECLRLQHLTETGHDGRMKALLKGIRLAEQ